VRERLDTGSLALAENHSVAPRPLARAKGIVLGLIFYLLFGRLGASAMRNLALAFPA